MSEKFSDLTDLNLKYGGGDDALRQVLSELSDVISELERVEVRQIRMESSLTDILRSGNLDNDVLTRHKKLSEGLAELKGQIEEGRQEGLRKLFHIIETLVARAAQQRNMNN